MSGSRGTDLEGIRDDLRKRLVAELAASTSSPKLVSELVNRVQAIETVARLQPKDKGKKWHLPVFIAALATGLVGIASLISLPRISVDVDASASEFRVHLDAAPRTLGGGLAIKRGSLVSVGHEMRALPADSIGNFASFTALQDIRLDGASTVTFGSKPGQCYELRVQKGALHGTLLRSGNADSDVVPWPVRISVPAPGLLQFCIKEESSLFLEGIDAVSLSTIVRAFPPPEVHAPSIVKGEINLPSINERRTLTSNDRLSLGGIEEGSLVVRFGETLRLSFSGTSSEPRLFGLSGPSSPSGKDLRPSLAALVKSSPEFTAIFAAIAGVATALMGALRWFGLRGDQ